MRVENWEIALSDCIEKHRGQPYQAGASDCFMMAMDCIEATTGTRHYPKVKYTSDFGAAKQLTRHGFAKLGDAVSAILPERERGVVQRGDIAVIPVDTGEALGVVFSGVIFWRSEQVVMIPLSAALRFYAV